MTLLKVPSSLQILRDRWDDPNDDVDGQFRRQPWRDIARPEQLAPTLLWFIWLILAGRGWGKTITGAQWAADKGRRYPGARIALVAATFADGRDTMVEGETGLLEVFLPHELRGGEIDKAWNRSLGELYLANGTRYKIYSSEKPRQLRGPQHHFAWADEIAAWKDAALGTAKDTTWSNLNIGVRLRAKETWPGDYRPQIVATTTPARVALLKIPDQQAEAEPSRAGLLQRPGVHVTRGRTMDNIHNLADSYREQVVDPLVGTRLGRQELDGELIEDVEGALWSQAQLDDDRVTVGRLPALVGVVTSVDPATKSTEASDETGIVTLARGLDTHGYVLEDSTLKGTPIEWASAAWLAALRHGSEAIVVEDNQGGDMVLETMRAAFSGFVSDSYRRAGRMAPPVRQVTSIVNKRARATPVAGMYEQHMFHHVSGEHDLVLLEDELTGWDGSGDSPNRLDALVHGARYLFVPASSKSQQTVVSGRWGKASGRR